MRVQLKDAAVEAVLSEWGAWERFRRGAPVSAGAGPARGPELVGVAPYRVRVQAEAEDGERHPLTVLDLRQPPVWDGGRFELRAGVDVAGACPAELTFLGLRKRDGRLATVLIPATFAEGMVRAVLSPEAAKACPVDLATAALRRIDLFPHAVAGKRRTLQWGARFKPLLVLPATELALVAEPADHWQRTAECARLSVRLWETESGGVRVEFGAPAPDWAGALIVFACSAGEDELPLGFAVLRWSPVLRRNTGAVDLAAAAKGCALSAWRGRIEELTPDEGAWSVAHAATPADRQAWAAFLRDRRHELPAEVAAALEQALVSS